MSETQICDSRIIWETKKKYYLIIQRRQQQQKLTDTMKTFGQNLFCEIKLYLAKNIA